MDKVRAQEILGEVNDPVEGVSIPVDKVRARLNGTISPGEVLFQSPWIRFAQNLLVEQEGGEPKFQSPWIRFAPNREVRLEGRQSRFNPRG